MKNGKINLNIALFIIFIAVFSVLNLLQTKKPAVSELENRALKQRPVLSFDNVRLGTYFKDFEEYYSDTFILRENWVRLAKDIQEYKGFAGENGAELVPYNNNMAEALEDPNPVIPSEDYAAQVSPVPGKEADETVPPSMNPGFSAEADPADPDGISSPNPAETAIPSAESPQPSSEAVPDATPEAAPAASPEAAPTATPAATPKASAGQANPEPKKVGGLLIANGMGMETHYFSDKACKNYADTINRFKEKLDPGVKVYSLVAPIAIEFYNVEKFKDITSPQTKTISAINGYLDGSVIPVDAYTPISEHTAEYLYFRTDHHWTALGAYYAYTGFMKALGEEPTPLSKYETSEVKGFLGSTYQSTLSRTLEANPDTITIYKPFIPHEYTIYYEGPIKMNLIDMNRAKDQNKYRVFMSGDRPWSVIKTNVKNGRKIVVIKDSYGNAFIPFLLPHFEEIYTVDPRQYKNNILGLIKEKGIQNVLFLDYVNAVGLQSYLDLINQLTER